MTYEYAKRLLHPDTMLEAIREVDAVKAAEQACIKACEAIDKALASQWVPVSESLPETVAMSNGRAYSEAVVTLTNEKKLVIAVYDGIDFVGDYDFWDCNGEHVTHWMPLPEPPKEGTT